MLFVKPVTVIGDDAPVPVIPPGDEVTTYSVAAGFPRYAGAVKVTVACASPAVAVPMVGVPGLRPPDEELALLSFTIFYLPPRIYIFLRYW